MTALFVLPVMVLLGWAAVAASRVGWRVGILVGYLLWLSGWLVGAAALSVIGRFDVVGIAVVQVVQLLIQAVLLRRRRPTLPKWSHSWLDPWVVVLAVEALVLLVIALNVAPTNWDSMSYHLVKVAQWEQAGSVGPFAAEFAPQVYLPFLAEIGMAQFFVLSDALWSVNLVQYAAHLVGLVAVSVLARNVGIQRRGQAIAAGVFGLSPLIVGEAVTTQTDYVMCTLVVIAYVIATMRPQDRRWLVLVALASGLAVAVKPTAVLAVLPAVVWSFRHLRGINVRQTVLPIVASALIGVLANVWWMGVNHETWGSVTGVESGLTAQEISVGGVAANLVKNLSLQGASQWTEANEAIESGVRETLEAVGINADDPATTLGPYVVQGAKTADRAGNPLQVVLILIALIALAVGWRRRRELWPVAASLFFVCLATATVLKWQVFGGRFLLTAIALGAVLVGAAMTRWPRWLSVATLVALTAYSLPFLLEQHLRPLVGERSVLASDVETELFTGLPGLAWSYDHFVDSVEALDDPEPKIGLALGMWHWEFPLWYLIKQRVPGATIGNVTPCPETVDGEQPDQSEWDLVITWEAMTGEVYALPEGCAH